MFRRLLADEANKTQSLFSQIPADLIPQIQYYATPWSQKHLKVSTIYGKQSRSSYCTSCIAVDNHGVIHVAHTTQIKKLSGDRLVVVAGCPLRGDLDGPAHSANLGYISSFCFDKDNNIIVVDRQYHKIKKISAVDGHVTTIAGSTQGWKDGYPARSAQFKSLVSCAIDRYGNIFVSDSSCIRKITFDGEVETVAGSHTTGGLEDGPGLDARLMAPTNFCFDSCGSLWFTDGSSIRFFQNNAVETLRNPCFQTPFSMCIDPHDNLLITTSTRQIKMLPIESGLVTTFCQEKPRGFNDGPVEKAWFEQILAICIDRQGNLLLVDVDRVRKIPVLPD